MLHLFGRSSSNLSAPQGCCCTWCCWFICRFITDRVARARPRTPGEEVGQSLVLLGPNVSGERLAWFPR
jgi:hypothetical protein